MGRGADFRFIENTLPSRHDTPSIRTHAIHTHTHSRTCAAGRSSTSNVTQPPSGMCTTSLSYSTCGFLLHSMQGGGSECTALGGSRGVGHSRH